MIRKAMLLILAAGTLAALAVPSMASAQQLKDEGEVLAENAKITATSANFKTTTAIGVLECKAATIHATVSVNSEITSKAVGLNNVTTKDCVLNQPGDKTLTTKITDGSASFHLEFGGPDTAAITFVADIGPSFLECHFAGTVGVTWVANTDTFHIEGALAVTKPGCPTEPATISGDFTLETESGVPVTID